MVKVEIDKRSLQEIEELRERHREAFKAIDPGTLGSPAEQMIFFIIDEGGEVWEATAPRQTGTLAMATRERLDDGSGRIFIDPGVSNPISGGLPVVYGPVAHERTPWVDSLANVTLPGIMFRASEKFLDQFGEIYQQ